MKRQDDSTKVAGVDVSKATLDVVDYRSGDHLKLANHAGQFAQLGMWLKAHGVKCVGMEATGGYEHALYVWLRKAGFGVVVHQPAEVKYFARFKRIRIKTDKADATLIAGLSGISCTGVHNGYEGDHPWHDGRNRLFRTRYWISCLLDRMRNRHSIAMA